MPRAIWSDPCCYRASFATVLGSYGCHQPELLLGSTVSTLARLEGGSLRFGDVCGLLGAAVRLWGVTCRWRAATPSSWAHSLTRLKRGIPVIGVVDPFHLPYYWIDFGRTHSLHAVVLWSVDELGEEVELTDPSELARFDGRVKTSQLRESWADQCRGQGWLDLEGTPPELDTERLRDLAGTCAQRLVADREHLSGLELASYLGEHLEDILTLMVRLGEPDARLGTDDERKRLSHLLRGIWNYHHALRWLAEFVVSTGRRSGSSGLVSAGANMKSLAQDWLVLRNVLMKFGMSPASRRANLGRFCHSRVHVLSQGCAESADAVHLALGHRTSE